MNHTSSGWSPQQAASEARHLLLLALSKVADSAPDDPIRNIFD